MKLLNTMLIVVGATLLVLIGTMFVGIEQSPQKTQIIEKTHPLYPIQYQGVFKDIRPANGFTKGYLDKRGAGYGMAFHCELTFIQF